MTAKVKENAIVVTPPAAEKSEWKAVGGSNSDNFNFVLFNQLGNCLPVDPSDKNATTQKVNSAMAALAGIKPRDELEGMLGAQLIATHNAAMESFRRATQEQQTFETRREFLNQANKLVRSFSTLLEALDRYRGKGERQRVTVERVNVNEGGQAIVGTVHPAGTNNGQK